MQNQYYTNHGNSRNVMTSRLSPMGYCVAGIVGLLVLFFFGKLLLLLAVIGVIGWLLWKFRRAVRYYLELTVRAINAKAQAFRQKHQNNRSGRSNR